MPSNPSTQASHLMSSRTASGTATPSHGSATQTINDTRPISPEPLVLRLRGEHQPRSRSTSHEPTELTPTSRRRRIQWAEDVIDNEGLGRKKSKVCCIFHKTREVGESSSDESSSSSSSDSEGGSSSGVDDDGGARPVGGARKRGRRRKGRGDKHHDHKHEDGCDHGGNRKPSPNAYERMPKYDVKPLNQQPGN